MIKSFHNLDYQIIYPVSIKCTGTHVDCAPVSCPWYPWHAHGPRAIFLFQFFRKSTRVSAVIITLNAITIFSTMPCNRKL